MHPLPLLRPVLPLRKQALRRRGTAKRRPQLMPVAAARQLALRDGRGGQAGLEAAGHQSHAAAFEL
jgi:hypothetical protein